MPSEDTLIEVQRYLIEHRQEYIQFQELLFGELQRIKHTPHWANVIYRLYTRADKQYGDPFKQAAKIARDLDQERTKGPCSVGEIDDIIGLTVVVTYPSDRSVLTAYLQEPGTFREFYVSNCKEMIHEGYHAYHLRLETSTIQYKHIRCEVQLKTMLHDGWSAKTHDLTYKPGGQVSESLHRHMSVLGDVLRLLDEQSEIIKNAITEKWNADKRRKETAQRQLLFTLVHDVEEDAVIGKLAGEIVENCDQLSVASNDEPLFKDIFGRIMNVLKERGHKRSTSYLVVLLASVRGSGDLNGYALSTVDKWRGSASSKEERARALVAGSLTNYVFGEFAKAVEDTEEAWRYCQEQGLSSFAMTAKMNRSYFIAEAHFHHRMLYGTEWAQRALRLIREVLADAPEEKKANYLDTWGAIEIACGETEADIRSGLRHCQEALSLAREEHKDDALFLGYREAYYRLHEHRAFRRLIELE